MANNWDPDETGAIGSAWYPTIGASWKRSPHNVGGMEQEAAGGIIARRISSACVFPDPALPWSRIARWNLVAIPNIVAAKASCNAITFSV